MLCYLCEAAFDILRKEHKAKDQWQRKNFTIDAPHHTPFSLEKSAASGCRICVRVWHIVRGPLSVQVERDCNVLHQDRFRLRLWFLEPSHGRLSAVIQYICKDQSSACFLDTSRWPNDFEALQVSDVDFQDPIPAVSKHLDEQSARESDFFPWSRILEWIDRCDRNHATCQRQSLTKKWRPDRLIDIEAGSDRNLLRLVDSKDLQGQVSYITLSHRWGQIPKQERYVFNAQNETEMRQGFRQHVLAQTFRDFVDVARHICSRYIWVDLLCIRQDSKGDWQHQSSQMGRVYEYSYLNIAASSAVNSNAGLFSAFNPDLSYFGIREGVTDGVRKGTRFVLGPDLYLLNFIFVNEPLHKRAWVLQELFLSPRVLFFASDQLRWRCQECIEGTLEGRPSNKTPSFKSTGQFLFGTFQSPATAAPATTTTVEELGLMWRQILDVYPTYGLSYETDRLIALSGLAQRFLEAYESKGCSTTYLAGLWLHNLTGDLLWYYRSPQKHRTCDYVAPSWSWAHSNDNDIIFHGDDHGQICQSRFEFLSSALSPIHEQDPLGRLSHGLIKCRVSSSIVRVIDDDPWGNAYRTAFVVSWPDLAFSAYIDEVRWDSERPFRSIEPLLLVVIATGTNPPKCYGLLLKETVSSVHPCEAVYERVGYWEHRFEPYRYTREWDRLCSEDETLRKTMPRPARVTIKELCDFEDRASWQEIVVV